MLGQYRTKNPPRRVPATPRVGFDMGDALGALQKVAQLKQKLEREVDRIIKAADVELNRMRKIQRGLPGKDGHTPVKGVDYIDGRPGKDGKPGRDGRPGKDANGSEIVKSIMSAVRKMHEGMVEKVTTAAIAAVKAYVEEAIKAMRTEVRSASSRIVMGGGMGTIKYFKFACDGSDTSFELPDIPTQDGAAVFPRYEGQALYPGDHFTVSGRTLTTTFVGAGGTYIDGFLIT